MKLDTRNVREWQPCVCAMDGKAAANQRGDLANSAPDPIDAGMLMALFDFTPDAMLISDASGTILLASRQVEVLLGYDTTELIGRPVEMLVPESARRHHVQMRSTFAELPRNRTMGGTGKPLYALRKDGSTLPVDISLGPIQTARGMLIATAIRNATTRVGMESALRKLTATLKTRVEERTRDLEEQIRIRAAAERSAADAMARLETITDGLPEIVVQYSWHRDRLQLEFVNRQCEALLGVEAAAAVADISRLLDTVIAEDRASVLESMRLAADPVPQSWMHEFRVRDRHGNIRWMRGEAVPEWLESDLAVWNGHWQDITEQKGTEESLRQTLRQLKVLLRTTPTAIALVRERTFVSCNPAMREFFGYAPEELLGRSTRILYASDAEYEEYGKLTNALFESGKPARMQVDFVHKNGAPITALVAGGLLDPGSGISVWSFTDITAQKNLNEEIERARVAAEEANAAKSSFLATMSHEIRTPLHGMMGMLELVGRTSLNADQQESIALVRQSANSLLRIINDVLDLSKIEAGRMEIHAAAASVTGLARELGALHGMAASHKGLEMILDLDDSLAPAYLVDETRLRQVLNNLLSNAVKFTGEGSVALRIEVAERTREAEVLRFSVEDSGIGFSDEDRKRLFTPFVQLHAGSARKYGGTGLGLSICRRLVDAMGGSIAAQGRPGRGTRMSFALRLPVAQETRNAAVDPETPVAGAAACADDPSYVESGVLAPIVLAVDDHPVNLRIIERQLRTLGYRVETAISGAEALAIWKSVRIDLVLTDCHMPDVDGYALAREIRRIESARGSVKRVPIIACSADALVSERDAAREAGMDDFLIKPVGLVGIRRALGEWLHSSVSGGEGPG